ncbi:MAG: 50S ribosomal protein L24 [Chloroflexota bacterium]
MRIRKNDNVLVIAGKDRGKKGKVRQALPKKNRVVVEGLNMVKRHSRAKGQARQAGIIELESPIEASNVMLMCSKCSRPVRVGYQLTEDGRKIRICRACREAID